MDDVRKIEVNVNGSPFIDSTDVRTTLADFLRQNLGLTGTHLGCEHGVCGACTVLVDGQSMRSCLMLAVQAHGSKITTVEGLATEQGKLNILQEAFRTHHALQCGFCTPGILMSLTELLQSQPHPTEQNVRDVLSGHLCRCTGYQPIVIACLSAAHTMRGTATKDVSASS